MLNNHEDVIEDIDWLIEDMFHSGIRYALDDAPYSEYPDIKSKIICKVQQRLEYMQSQIDELQAKLTIAQMSDVRMFIDWSKTGYGDKSCAVLCRKIGDVVEIIDTQYSPYE